MDNETVVKRPKKWTRELREWFTAVAIAVVLSLLIQNYAFAQVQVFNISMQNTLVEGQRLFEDKISYHLTTPKRGEVVIIDSKAENRNLVKRVIALPGETIDFRDGAVYINDEKLDESYTKGLTYSNNFKTPYVVPDHSVFVLGDNRENSEDSRVFGAVSYSDIDGRILFRVWPLNKFGSL
ncbi:signal peptidase I [Paenibacillus cellulosilyticus]|uniref:Signal peptidase I n=1 Tax=Paenibacillus cellulosilyticus TaxID=375489 RepID=A0A2V2YEP9_9BACL|nr:signal peptidase I [Paenibacillus cellulosilyticus]PWV90964.1 signal peptidase I [Paenibacillus cellulosilyticus]QKS45182.1 signal peptidase I [Paenibacillus cellulosilyticus]